MTKTNLRQITKQGRATTLAVIIILQALCALFFAADVVLDLAEGGHLDDVHLLIEGIASFALVGGVVLLMMELRDLLHRLEAMEVGVRAARGEMANLMDTFFNEWKLTPSEREIALYVLKGLDNETIAGFRQTAPGTVRAQCTRIYAKAGVDSRSQLLSVFVEELFANDPV